MTLTLSRAIVLACIYFGLAQGGTLANSPIVVGPEATATIAQATYCFARSRGLDPDHLPQAYLVLQLRIRVSYRNPGARPLIMPLQRERTIYTALRPGTMSIFHESLSLFDSANKPMKDLPPGVGPGAKNDVFTVIPAGGEMTPPLFEDITLPVNRKVPFKTYADLRGHRLYLRLRFAHQQISAALDADLSDRWARFGVPWTGTLLTNTMAIDVPPHAPQAVPCTDEPAPARF